MSKDKLEINKNKVPFETRKNINRTQFIGNPQSKSKHYSPVLPKPPSPRSVSSRLSTSTNSSSA